MHSPRDLIISADGEAVHLVEASAANTAKLDRNMAICKHTSWLTFHVGKPVLFRQTSTLSDIVASLDSPAEKWPSLIVLIDDAKSGTLIDRVLPTSRKHAELQGHEGVTLHLDPDSVFSDRPVLMARSHLSVGSVLTPEPDLALCHRNTVRELQWDAGISGRMADALHGDLLFPFASVICLFASEHDDLEIIVNHLEAWCKRVQNRPCQNVPLPRLLLITGANEKRRPAAVYTHLLTLLQKRSVKPCSNFFSCITVFVERHSRQSLKDRVRQETDISRNLRAQNHTLLNALHFDYYFRHACDHFVVATEESFDMIAAARLHRPVSTSLSVHMEDLLAHVNSYEEMTEVAIPYIAECLLKDNYTTDVHSTYTSSTWDKEH